MDKMRSLGMVQRSRLWAALLILFVLPFTTASTVAQEVASCADYDAWEWAQAVFESNPARYEALDADDDGIACPELPRGGFAPAFWTDAIPHGVQEAELVRIIAADTFEVQVDGEVRVVRTYRADAPEPGDEPECGAQEAMDFVGTALSFNDSPDVVYLGHDVRKLDVFGDPLAYLWFEVDGKPYLLNHVLLSNGWAEDVDEFDARYDKHMREAAAFAHRHELGLWRLCREIGTPAAGTPAPTPFDPTIPQSKNGDEPG
jgi:endonuclease YncB( thermonuclease family)